jgi:hypothetical protein
MQLIQGHKQVQPSKLNKSIPEAFAQYSGTQPQLALLKSKAQTILRLVQRLVLRQPIGMIFQMPRAQSQQELALQSSSQHSIFNTSELFLPALEPDRPQWS